MNLQTPAYFQHYGTPYKLVRPPEGGLAGYLLDPATGRFVEDNDKIDDVLWAREGEIGAVPEEDFIRRTEEFRREYLRGDGPIFALYETIDAMHSVAKEEGHAKISREQGRLKMALYLRTFKMWEDEFARRDAGEPPTFSYTSTLGR